MTTVPGAPPRRPYHLLQCPPPAGGHWLAHLQFGVAPLSPAGVGDPRRIRVPLPVLAGPADECWASPTPVQHGWQDGLGYAENGALLFGQLSLGETELDQLGVDRAVFHAYARINHLLHGRGYPHWLRMWNFLSRITEGEGEDERYRRFNTGRSRALELKREFERLLPAATAIGSVDGGLTIYFIGAATVQGAQVENPRQVSAFHYPQQYGLKSPSFSRATRVEWADGGDLLVSGTASVVGHETRHAGDLPAQLHETFTNLDALVATATAQRGGGLYQPHSFKLYLTDPAALPALKPLLQTQFGSTPVSCLAGAICRRDLALEIEGIYTAGPRP